MPTYDYECLSCKDKFELFQQMKDQPLKICPKCQGKVKRLIGSGFGLIFKGSGFYETDYKKKNPPVEAKKESNIQCSGCDKTTCPQLSKPGE